MKKICIAILAFVLFSSLGKAQTETMSEPVNLLNYSALENKLKKSNSDIQDPKKNIKAKTWINRATLMLDIYNIHIQYLQKGMSQNNVKIFFREPKEVKTYQDQGVAVEEHIYERITLIYKNGTLDSWVETNKVYDKPLEEAKRSLEEAIKLDAEKKETKEIITQLNKLKLGFETEAVFKYNSKDYQQAYNYFSQILEVNKLPVMENIQDTIIIYNTGRAALEMKDFNEALRLFIETKKLGFYDYSLPVFIKNCYFGLGDTLNGVKVLREDFNEHPDNQLVVIELINYYLLTQNSKEALEMLAVAKKSDPSNISFIFAEGTLYDRLGDFEKAKETYFKCLEINPEYYDAVYNLGVIHYNKAVKMYEEMININDNAEYEKAKKAADDMFKSSIPYMEKAHELKPTERAPLETLKTLYYRLQMNDKYEEVTNILKSM
jgi:tetratricopeptide (TPR) repeat protein